MRGEWDIFSSRKLVKIAREFGANIIHAHTARAHSIGLAAKKALGEDVILLVSRRVDFPIRTNFLSKRKYYNSLVNGYIAISQKIKDILIQDGIDASKIDVAYSGIDLSVWEHKKDPIALRSEFMLHHETLGIGNVAALVDHKDHMNLLRAARILNDNKQLPSWRLFILGDGKNKSALQTYAKENDILFPNGPVVFCGHRDDVYDFYYLFDLFVISSKEEGLGTAILDAMAAALPVCATRAGGIPEIIRHNAGGLLSEVGDSFELAKNIETLLCSKDLRVKFGSYNKKEVQKFGRTQTAISNLDIYKKYLGIKF